jgi:hypothetical protein
MNSSQPNSQLRILNSQFPKFKHLSQDLFHVVWNFSINHNLTFQRIVVHQKECCTRERFNSQNSIVNYIISFLLYIECGGMTNKFSKLQYT